MVQTVVLNKIIFKYKSLIGFFLLLLLFSTGIFINNYIKSIQYPLPASSAIKIDGVPTDWTKNFLRCVDGERVLPRQSPHITALYSYEGVKNFYFSLFYPNWVKEKSAVLLGLSFNGKGNRRFLNLPVVSTIPSDLFVLLSPEKALLLNSSGNIICKLDSAFDSFDSFIELSIPKKFFEGMAEDNNEIKIQAVAFAKQGKKIKVLDTVPNGINKIIKGIGPGFLLLKSASSVEAAGTVKLMIVHHGNQSVGGWYPNLLSENGGQNGYNPVLAVHLNTGVKVNFHISGSTLVGLRWQGGYDDTWSALGNKTWFQAMKDGINSNLIGLVGSAFAQHIMPYMYHNENVFALKYENELMEHFFNSVPEVAWVPERTWVNDPNIQWHSGDGHSGPNNNVKDKVMCETFTEAGFKAVILDGNQHHNWFHNPDPMGQNDNCVPHKIIDPTTGQFSGLVALFNNRDIQDRMCCGSDDCWNGLNATMSWVATFGDGAVGVYGDDLEKAAGYSDTWPDFLTDGYVTMIWRIKNQSWIESITVKDYLSWFAFQRDGQGTPSYPDTPELPSISIPYGTYENPVIWLNGGDYYQRWDDDASETARLKTDSRSYRDMMIFANNAISSAEEYTWQDWTQNRLIKVARAVLAATAYEWMWHDDGDNISDWQEKMSAHTKNACYYAEAAKWAYNPSTYGAKVQSKDVDGDGTTEYILQNNKVMAIFEPDGGRICAMFTRDSSGQGYVIIGNDVAQYYAEGGNWPDMSSCGIYNIDWVEPDHMGALLYHMAEVNDGYWYDNHQPTGNPYGDCTQYPDTVYSANLGSDYIEFKSGATTVKKITLAGANNYFDVEIDINTPPEYTDWPNKKAVIVQFNPDYLNILKNGKDALADYTFTDGSLSGYGVRNSDNSVRGWVAVPASTTIEKSYKMLTREYLLKNTDSGNPFIFKLGADKTEAARGTIAGNVKDTNNNFLSGVSIVVAGPEQKSTQTAGDGTYSISDLLIGQYTVTATKDGFENFITNNLSVLDGQTTILNITMRTVGPAYGSISGTVTKTNTSTPVDNAYISLSSGSHNYSTYSSSLGAYTIDNVITGTYTLNVSKSGYYPKTINNVVIIENNNTVVNVELVKIPEAPGKLKGIITIANGDYSGITVSVAGNSAWSTTNIDPITGYYEILNIDTGIHTVYANKQGYMSTPPQTNVQILSGEWSTVNFELIPNPYWPGDFNGDEKVDMVDYMELKSNFGGNNPKYDLNNDGIVDGKDLAIFSANYGKTGRRP